MAFAEMLDTLGAAEQTFITQRCEQDLPSHDVSLHSNDEGITWVVLTPPAITPELLRFTICRIAPSVMVMIEDAAARRQIRGLPSIEAALGFVCEMVAETMPAIVHGGDSRTLH